MCSSVPRSKSLSSLNESFHYYPTHSMCASDLSEVHNIKYHGHENNCVNGENNGLNNTRSDVYVNHREKLDDTEGDSDSSVEVYIVNDHELDDYIVNDQEMNDSDDNNNDSGLGGDEAFAALENKIDQLNDLYEEQCSLLTDIKEELRSTKPSKQDPPQQSLVMELLVKALELSSSQCDEVPNDEDNVNHRAKSLLNALQSKRTDNLDREIAQALVDFLNDENLSECVITASVQSVRETVDATLSRDMASLYLPALHRCHRRLVRHHANVLENAFQQLERQVASWSFSNLSWLVPALQRHLYHHDDAPQFRNMVQLTLEKELQRWRERALETVLTPEKNEEPNESCDSEASLALPRSPPQPAEPGRCIIDQLMMTAEINKQIQDGDINGSFDKALSASDLSLVMAACRAIEPARVFTPTCRLRPHVLLSLLQQLATDMLHETHLKCSYLEEAVISLNTSIAPAIRSYLPLVIADVRKHLTSFLAKYPSHVASRRVMLIVMAADNLLK